MATPGQNGRVNRQLRVLSTVLLAFAVAQAGFGSGYLDGTPALLVAHEINAFAVLALCLVAAVLGWTYRRAGAPGWTFVLPLVLVVAAALQMTLGFVGVLGGHVFLGVLILCTVTAYCSYSYRLAPGSAQRPSVR